MTSARVRTLPAAWPRGRAQPATTRADTDRRADTAGRTVAHAPPRARAPAHQNKTVARLAKRAKCRVAREHERSKGRQRGGPLGHRPRCGESQGCVRGGRPEPGDPAPMSAAAASSRPPPPPPPSGRLRASLGARRSRPASFPEVGSRPQSGSGRTGRAGRVPGARHLVPGPRRRAPNLVHGGTGGRDGRAGEWRAGSSGFRALLDPPAPVRPARC